MTDLDHLAQMQATLADFYARLPGRDAAALATAATQCSKLAKTAAAKERGRASMARIVARKRP